MSTQQKSSFPYMPGLDGLRALAVLSVIAYHVNLPFAQGGFLGVTVFFVLSGYLITSLLVWEWSMKHTIDLKSFWIRRAKRLLPGMFLLLLTLNLVIPFMKPEFASTLHSDTLPAIFYYSNWHYIFQNLSYFETYNSTSLLTHFWSLAIEEQFYIFWAIAMLLGFKFLKNRISLFWITLGITVLSILSMVLMYHPNTDPSRIYYGTDTRLFSLLIGAGIALLFPSHQLAKTTFSTREKWIFEVIGLIGIASFLWFVVSTNQYSGFIYQGGMVLASITTGLLVLSLALPSTVLVNAILKNKVLKWVGVRSYGIYLWHYPVITLMSDKINTNGLDYTKIVLEIAIIFILAAFSYTFVEKPIRDGNFKYVAKNAATIVAITCVFSFSTTLVTKALHHEPSKHQAVQKEKTNKAVVKQANKEEEQKREKAIQALPTKKITAIGDSVLIDPTPFLKEKFPNLTADTQVGRQMWDINDVINGTKQAGGLGEIVIIELGSNGAFEEDTMKTAIESIGKETPIFFINTRVPRPWESVVNNSLEKITKEFSNTHIIDWHTASTGHDEYFVKDGVHLNPTGAKAYAEMIEQALKDAATTF